MWLWHHNVTLFTAEATQLLRGRRALFCHCPFIVAVPSRRRDQEAWRPVVDPHHPHPDHDARGVSPRDPPGVPPGYSPSAGKNPNAQIMTLAGTATGVLNRTRELCARPLWPRCGPSWLCSVEDNDHDKPYPPRLRGGKFSCVR